jgi:hypothetical protein
MTIANWAEIAFQERQRLWTGFERTFIQNNGRGQRPNIWKIQVSGGRVTTIYGVQDGQMQTTDYVGKEKNKGRSNFISSEQDAIAEARRDVRKKWDFEGYDEVFNGVNIDRRNENTSIPHLLTALPGSFSLYKPENNIETCKKLLKLADSGRAWFTLKRDGMAKLVVVDYYGNVTFYSRRARAYHHQEGPKELLDGTLDHSTVIPWNVRFPHLVDAVRKLQLPPGTMLAGELVYQRDGKDDFPFAGTITKSLTPQALEEMKTHGYPTFYWWCMPFWGGQDLISEKPFGEVTSHMRAIWEAAPNESKAWIQPLDIRAFQNTTEALAEAKRLGIEGWVVVDPTAVFGDRAWNLKGKPDRPSSIAKLKPKAEDDFVAYWDPDNKIGEWGTGKHEKGKTVTLPNGQQVVHNGVGSIALHQYNSAGELVFICNCSSGMDYEFQAKLSKKDFPFVAKVEYPERTYMSDGEKTNALRHPVFLLKRDDKTIAECVNDRL